MTLGTSLAICQLRSNAHLWNICWIIIFRSSTFSIDAMLADCCQCFRCWAFACKLGLGWPCSWHSGQSQVTHSDNPLKQSKLFCVANKKRTCMNKGATVWLGINFWLAVKVVSQLLIMIIPKKWETALPAENNLLLVCIVTKSTLATLLFKCLITKHGIEKNTFWDEFW